MAKPPPRLLTVTEAFYLTPHMIRVTLRGDMTGISAGCEGANCKLFIPHADQSLEDFKAQFERGERGTVRTYTVRHFDAEAQIMTIDFVAHGDEGPASAWAMRAKTGDFIGFAGPGPLKIAAFEADHYLFAADMSALPVVAAVLESMPRDAKGVAFFEIQTEEDLYPVNAPEGIEINWILHPDPHQPSTAQIDACRNMNWPEGRVQTCIAGESAVIKELRGFLHREKMVPREDTYISGYWKIGMIEDQHQKFKRTDAA